MVEKPVAGRGAELANENTTGCGRAMAIRKKV